jgi:predicted DNA-binding transcriptional regulator YafY
MTEEKIAQLADEHDKHKDSGVLAVWDLQNNGWRSFRIDSVEYAQIIEGY